MAYEIKTKKTTQSVTGYINALADDERKADAKVLLKIMKDVTGEKPKLWGNSIIGFGSYHYVSKSGCTGEWPMIGFSPRKQQMVVYIMLGLRGHKDLLKKLGPHKTGVSCLYIKRLRDIHLSTLKTLIKKDFQAMKKKYPPEKTRKKA